MNKILRIILAIATILFIGVVYANKQEVSENEIKKDFVETTIYSGYVITTTNLWQTVANYEEIEFKVNPPKKKVVKQWVSFLDRSNTHYSWKEEMEAQPVFSTWEVQELIRKYAQKHWVNESLALRIAWSESWYRYWAKNTISTAWWVFQQLLKYRDARANKYWHPWASRFNAEANIEVSIQMLKYEWTSHRSESSWTWNK